MASTPATSPVATPVRIALLRTNVPSCRPLTVQKLLGLLENPGSLQEVNERRDAVAHMLGAYSHTPGTPGAAGRLGFDVAQTRLREYLADALGLEKALSSLPDTVEVRFGFEWTSVLSSQLDKVYVSDSPRYEVAMVLVTLALIGMNEASLLLLQGELADAAKVTANRLCELAGLWEYVASFSGIPLRNSSEPATRKPLEVASVSTCNAMSNVCMAQAEEIGAISALFRDTTLGLVAKLFMRAHNLYRETERHLQALQCGPPEPTRAEAQYINEYIAVFVRVKAMLTLAMAHKCIAMDKKIKSAHGIALAHMNTAKKLLVEAKEHQKTSPVLGSQTDDLGSMLWSQLSEQEPSVNRLQEKYERENESVFFETVPESNQLQLPMGTSVFQVKPFALMASLQPTAVDITVKSKQADSCTIS